MIASPSVDSADGIFSPPGLGERVLPVAAIYGANASGTTAAILALNFMANAVKWSHSHWLPDRPFPADPFVGEDEELPCRFETDFLVEGIRHEYGFAANSSGILHEWLSVYPKGKRQLWFNRTHGRHISFGSKMPGENRTIEGLTRANSLSFRRRPKITIRHYCQSTVGLREWHYRTCQGHGDSMPQMWLCSSRTRGIRL